MGAIRQVVIAFAACIMSANAFATTQEEYRENTYRISCESMSDSSRFHYFFGTYDAISALMNQLDVPELCTQPVEVPTIPEGTTTIMVRDFDSDLVYDMEYIYERSLI